MAPVNENIENAVNEIRIVDTHEHLMPEALRDEYAVDFGYLLAHYNTTDLVSSGMPLPLLQSVRLPMYRYELVFNEMLREGKEILPPERDDLSLEERWQALEPYWERIRNTAYAKQTLLAVKDIFGFDDLSRETYAPLSQAIAKSRGENWYRKVMKEMAGIDLSVVDIHTTAVDREHFVPAMRMDYIISVRTRTELDRIESEEDMAVHSLDDLVRAMRSAMERAVGNGTVAIKSALAYRRPLRYEKVTRQEAETAFNRIAADTGHGPSWTEAKPLQDFMMHQVIRQAVEVGIPMQIHTGLHESNESVVYNSNPTLLVNLFMEYREARFDLFHGGYPYIHEWATLAKNFANVYADMTWLEIISPSISRALLHELIETVPGNKIAAFGGDAITVEMAYAHAKMTREVVSRVLSEKVAEGYMSEAEAVSLASKMLRDNPAELFQLNIA